MVYRVVIPGLSNGHPHRAIIKSRSPYTVGMGAKLGKMWARDGDLPIT